MWYSLATVPLGIVGILRQYRTLRLGTKTCKVEEWVRLPLCFKCQKMGHKAHQCGETTQAPKTCYRCGSDKHLIGTCTAQNKRCSVCNVDGHRPDSMACPEYKNTAE